MKTTQAERDELRADLDEHQVDATLDDMLARLLDDADRCEEIEDLHRDRPRGLVSCALMERTTDGLHQRIAELEQAAKLAIMHCGEGGEHDIEQVLMAALGRAAEERIEIKGIPDHFRQITEAEFNTKICGTCARLRGEHAEYFCALEGPECIVEPDYPAEYCSGYIANSGGADHENQNG